MLWGQSAARDGGDKNAFKCIESNSGRLTSNKTAKTVIKQRKIRGEKCAPRKRETQIA
jgi:hypothetical protein